MRKANSEPGGASSADPADTPLEPIRHPGLVLWAAAVLTAAAVALVWLAAHVLLLAFASVLFGILLRTTSRRLQQRLPGWLPSTPTFALATVIGVGLLTLGLGGWLLAPGIAEQANELLYAVPRAIERLQGELQRYGVSQKLLARLPSGETIASDAVAMLIRAGGLFSSLVGTLTNVVVISVVGIYLAAQPGPYISGLLVLVPPGKRARAKEVVHALGDTLAEWLMGKLLSMVIIGVITATGLALLGVPLALVLGILAGLLDFIPYIGPILAGVPAVLIAFSESPLLAAYVLLLFVALQVAEGYLLLPLIERQTVSLPPALTIFMQVLLGSFFGLSGVALATPLTAVVAVMVTMLYVQDVLGDRVKVPGQRP